MSPEIEKLFESDIEDFFDMESQLGIVDFSGVREEIQKLEYKKNRDWSILATQAVGFGVY